MKNNFASKGLTVAIVFLFLGVAFAPSINANVPKEEYVEITTEICGIDGIKPKTVKLTKQESIEIEQLFNDIKVKLDKAETREETIEIFNDAIVEIDKYGLLGGLSIEQAQNLIIRPYHNSRVLNFINTLFKTLNRDEDLSCLLVFLFAETNGGFFVNPFFFFYMLLYFSLSHIPEFFNFIIDSYKVRKFFLDVLGWYCMLKPLRFMHIISFSTGFHGHSDYFYSIGIGGINIGTTELEAIVGFKGLTLAIEPLNNPNNPEKIVYIGFANAILFY